MHAVETHKRTEINLDTKMKRCCALKPEILFAVFSIISIIGIFWMFKSVRKPGEPPVPINWVAFTVLGFGITVTSIVTISRACGLCGILLVKDVDMETIEPNGKRPSISLVKN